MIRYCLYSTAQFKLNTCKSVYTHVPSHIPCVKLENIGMHMYSCTRLWCTHDCSAHTRHTNDAHRELPIGLPYYMCGAQVQ